MSYGNNSGRKEPVLKESKLLQHHQIKSCHLINQYILSGKRYEGQFTFWNRYYVLCVSQNNKSNQFNSWIGFKLMT